MSKTIKVEEHIYDCLDLLRGKRETFSDVIKELLDSRKVIFEALNMLEGQVKYQAWKREQINGLHEVYSSPVSASEGGD